MKAKRLLGAPCLLLALILIIGCKPKSSESEFKPTNQQKAEDVIKSWVLNNKEEYSHYKPIVFGELTARYERSDKAFHLATQIYDQEAISKETGDTQKLDSLNEILYSIRGNPLGYIILHKFETTNLAGEILINECLFFLDTALRVASVLTPESFDQILTEKTFYQLDPEN